MPTVINPEWQRFAVYAFGAAVVLIILFRIPYVGRALRALFSVGINTNPGPQ